MGEQKSGVKDIKLIQVLENFQVKQFTQSYPFSDFSGTSNPEALTIELILKALRKNYSQFSNYYDHFFGQRLIKIQSRNNSKKLKYKKKKKGKK